MKDYKAEFQKNREEWYRKHGFDENGYTYIITGESYSIKDELKSKGWIYDSTLKWHKKAVDEEYADRVIKIHISEVAEESVWGDAHYKMEAKKIIAEKCGGAWDELYASSNWPQCNLHKEALNMAIEALKQESIIDEIRVEIKNNRDEWIKGQDPEWHTYDRCLYIIDKYKTEKGNTNCTLK